MTSGIEPPSPETIKRAARLLAEGALVAFPSETVYGLGADARNDDAVAAIFEAKDRPQFNPLIAHFAEAAAADAEVVFEDRAHRLAERFWPGPLTLVLPRREACRLSFLCSAGLDTQAVRVPDHPVAQDLLAACGFPLAAPSANPSGAVSPTTARHVADGLGDAVSLIIDGGACRVGLESTVVDLSGARPRLLRPGGVTLEELEDCLEETLGAAGDGIRAPGMLESHYAPHTALRLNASGVDPDEALLAFGAETPEGAAVTENLSPTGDLREAAANLFAALRRLDGADVSAIAVTPIPEEGLGLAINDRLRRAAAPR